MVWYNIVQHIVKLAETKPLYHFNHLKPGQNTIEKIRSSSRKFQTGPGYLKSIFEDLNEGYDYDTIRLALIFA